MATIELNALNTAHNTQHHAITSNFLTEDSNISNPNNDLGTSGDGDNDPKDINDIFTTFDQETPIDIHPEWRRNIFALMEQPTSSPAAFLVHVMITGLIVLSALVTILETVPAFHSIGTKVWFAFETMLVVLFTFEYAARCLAWSWSWRSLAKWTLSFFGIIDLLSVLPYYIELALGADTSVLFRFSILRMFRLLRVFRPFRHNNTILLTIEVMYLSVRRSQHALLAIAFFVSMVLTVFSTLLYFAERGTWDDTLETFINADGDSAQFQSIPAAAWFVLVTITTVGYGEITPRSFLGRVITIPLLLFGLLFITLPSFVLGREFSIVWEKMSKGERVDDQNEDPLHSNSHSHFNSRTISLNGSHTRLPTDDPDEAHGRESIDNILSRPFLRRPAATDVYPPPSLGTLRPTATSTSASVPYYNHLTHMYNHAPPLAPKDLSNRKLAQNQTELSRQILELKNVVFEQKMMIEQLVKSLGDSRRERTRRKGDGGTKPREESNSGSEGDNHSQSQSTPRVTAAKSATLQYPTIPQPISGPFGSNSAAGSSRQVPRSQQEGSEKGRRVGDVEEGMGS